MFSTEQKQKIFDLAVIGTMRQGRAARHNSIGGCEYLPEDGLMCAIGRVFHSYGVDTREMVGSIRSSRDTIPGLRALGAEFIKPSSFFEDFEGEDIEFLARLQTIHDSAPVRDIGAFCGSFNREAVVFAEDHGLSTQRLDNYRDYASVQEIAAVIGVAVLPSNSERLIYLSLSRYALDALRSLKEIARGASLEPLSQGFSYWQQTATPELRSAALGLSDAEFNAIFPSDWPM